MVFGWKGNFSPVPGPQASTSSPQGQPLLPMYPSRRAPCICMPIYNRLFSHQCEHTGCTVVHLHVLFLAPNCRAAVGSRRLILRVLMKNSPLKLVATAIVRMLSRMSFIVSHSILSEDPREEFLSDRSTKNSCPSEQWVCFYLLDIVNCVMTRFPLSCWLLESLEPTLGPMPPGSRGFYGMHFYPYSWLHFLPALVLLALIYAALTYLVCPCKRTGFLFLRKGEVEIIK